MISKDEVQEVANKVRLQPTVVEKDYALGWFLAGINAHSVTQKWVFKGGTCLKKCYFETYRFSEDLDFSIVDGIEPTEADLVKVFSEISDWIMSAAGLEIPKSEISFEIFKNPRGTTSIQGRAAYRGPLRPQINSKNLPKVFLDLTLDEPLILPSVIKKVDHPYSDNPPSDISVVAYSYEEIFAEKTRALVQRLRPRDLYDVIHLHRRQDMRPDQERVKSTLDPTVFAYFR